MGFRDSFDNWVPSAYDVFENKRAQRRIHGQIQAAENLLAGDEPFDEDGFDLDGFDQDGFDRDGFDRHGFSRTGIHSSRYTLDIELERFFDEDGFDPFGFDRDGNPRI